MRLNGLDLNHLSTLDVLLEERSLTRVSEIIHISQPAVSNALSRLREHFEDELLVRRGREMVLTPFAENLRASLRLSLEHLRHVTLARPSFDPSLHTRHFSIMCSDYFAQTFMPAVIRRVTAEAPQISVGYVPIMLAGIEIFDRGDIDLLVIPGGKMTLSRHPAVALFQEEFVFIAAAGNQQIGNSISEQGFKNCPVVLPPHSQFILDRYWPEARHARSRPESQLPFSAIPFLVAQSEFVSVVPKRLAVSHSRFLAIKMVPPDGPPLVSTYVAQTHADKSEEPGVVWLLNLVRETTAETAALD